MNIKTINGVSWLTSACLTGGIAYYVLDFQRNRDEIMQSLISTEEATEILNSAQIPQGPKSHLVEIGAIERAFYFDPNNPALPNLLDWSGARPKVVVRKAVVENKPVEAPRKQISDDLTVQMVREATWEPTRSEAWLRYKPSSGVVVKSDRFLSRVVVGDKLQKPLDYVTVKAVTAAEGVTFSFDEEGREDETVSYQKFDSGVTIHVVTEDNPEIVPKRGEIPVLKNSEFRPDRTVIIADNHFKIGIDDARDFNEDFGGILAREVKHKRHYDPKTRKYDGIELVEVKPGGQVAAHGGQSGDIIKSINGHPVTSASEAISWAKNNKDKYDKWYVVVMNKGKERTMIFDSPPSN